MDGHDSQLMRLILSLYFSLFSVFDGHGGQSVSSFLSEQMHLLVSTELCDRTSAAHNLSDLLSSAFRKADVMIRQGQGSAPFGANAHSDPGSTAVVALLMGPSVVVANTGNSRALICSSSSTRGDTGRTVDVRDKPVGEFRPFALSRIHEVGQPEERARLLQAGASITGMWLECEYYG